MESLNIYLKKRMISLSQIKKLIQSAKNDLSKIKQKKLIDLSQIIDQNMPVYPGDISTKVEQDHNLTEDGYVNHNLTMGVHSGTHLDLPAHMLASKLTAADISLNQLSGRAVIINATEQKVISWQSQYDSLIRAGDRVLIYTGFDQKYGSNEYYQEHPALDLDLARHLADKKITLLGIDFPSPDYFPFPVHKQLFQTGIYILENLCNLDKLIQYSSFKLLVFPLKVTAEAAPCRVAAQLD